MKLPRAHHLEPDVLAGQLLMPAFTVNRLNRESPEMRRALRWVEKYNLGGFILFGGHPSQIHFTVRYLNDHSRIPLLFAADFERGLATVTERGTLFPHALAFGAADSVELVRQAAEAIAREIRAVGVNVVFAPVLDLADNPADTIINIRAFHASPEGVTRLPMPFIQALQAYGLACVGKHFPGHGAAALDSHIDLPVLNRRLEELAERELIPFKEAVQQGVKGLMVGHLALPDSPRPVPFRADVVEALIRNQWGFQGVLFTDALEMGAMARHFTPGRQAITAVQAGCDVLLMPEQLPLVHRILSETIARDPQFRRQVEKAVERIFRLKKWLHRYQPAQSHPLRIFKVVEQPTHVGLSRRVAEQAVTAVHRGPDFPLDLPAVRSVVHVLFTETPPPDHPLKHLQEQLEGFFDAVHTVVNPETEQVNDLPRTPADLVILSLYVRTYAANLQRLPTRTIARAYQKLIGNGRPCVVLFFGNPYRVNEIDLKPPPAAFFLLYSYVAASQQAAFKAVCSFIDVKGRLPISLPEPLNHSVSIKRKVYALAPSQNPVPAWKEVDAWVQQAIESGVFPGGVLLVTQKGRIAYWKAYGRFTYESDSQPVKPDTCYDLASLTKVLATTPAVFKLMEQHNLSLTDSLSRFYPWLEGTPQGEVQLIDLLYHRSGWPDWLPLYESHSNRQEMIDAILKTPLSFPRGSRIVYSDLGFMVLGDVVERVSGRPLDAFCRNQFFDPMGLQSLRFRPAQEAWNAIPPTGHDSFRARVVQGEVNDANAFQMGGVAGHAGLFGHALDVAAMAQMLLQRGIYLTARHLRGSTVEVMTRVEEVEGVRRAAGWDVPAKKNSSAGRYFSAKTIGHLAFTGPSVWVDLAQEVIVVFLCNRSHPDPAINRMSEFRPGLHDRVMHQVLSERGIGQ